MAKSKYEYWLTEEGLILIRGWARDGLTEENIAHNMGIDRGTLRKWKLKYEPINTVLKSGKEVADFIVENELYESCKTRRVTVKKPIKVKTVKRDGQKMIEEEHIEYIEEEVVLQANVTAQIFWLKNRKPAQWREKREELVKATVTPETIAEVEDYINGLK